MQIYSYKIIHITSSYHMCYLCIFLPQQPLHSLLAYSYKYSLLQLITAQLCSTLHNQNQLMCEQQRIFHLQQQSKYHTQVAILLKQDQTIIIISIHILYFSKYSLRQACAYYCKCRKILWAKHSQFQPYQVFFRNTFIVHWQPVFIIYLQLIIHRKLSQYSQKP